jgi:hypothetical protein
VEPRREHGLFRPVLPIVLEVCGLVCQHVTHRIQTAFASLN